MTRSYTTASTQNSPRTWRYTAVGGETTLSGVDGFSTTLSYAVGGEQLFVNGVLLERGVDYTATNGTSVTLSNALVVGDLVTINSQNTFAIANALPLATVTAKGDLIVGTASGAVTNLGVGADGTTLVANSSAGAGVSWAGPSIMAGKNAIINGAFDVWQRGTSFSVGGTTYTADRFLAYAGGANATLSQSTTVPSNGYSKYSLLITGATGNTTAQVFQRIESGTVAAFNRTVTFSFKVYNNSGAAYTPVLYVQTPNGLDNWATSANVISGVSLQSCPNGAWTTCSYTFNASTLSNISNGLGFVVDFGASSTLNSSSKSMNTTEWQLEVGSVATPFTRAGGTLQGELAACQRYYQRFYANSNGQDFGLGAFTGSTLLDWSIKAKTTFRVAPNVLETNNLTIYDIAGITSTSPTGTFTLLGSSVDYIPIRYTHPSGIFTNGRVGYVYGTTSTYIGLGAEL